MIVQYFSGVFLWETLRLLLWLISSARGVSFFQFRCGYKIYTRKEVFLNIMEEGGGAWIVNETPECGMEIVGVRQLVFRGMWFLVIVSVGYGSNNRLSGWERVVWMICHSNHKYLQQRLLPTIHQFSESK